MFQFLPVAQLAYKLLFIIIFSGKVQKVQNERSAVWIPDKVALFITEVKLCWAWIVLEWDTTHWFKGRWFKSQMGRQLKDKPLRYWNAFHSGLKCSDASGHRENFPLVIIEAVAALSQFVYLRPLTIFITFELNGFFMLREVSSLSCWWVYEVKPLVWHISQKKATHYQGYQNQNSDPPRQRLHIAYVSPTSCSPILGGAL